MSSIHPSHVAAHGGAYQVEGFFVQLEAFYKLGREMRKRLGYTAVDNDNGDYRVENLCTSYGDK